MKFTICKWVESLWRDDHLSPAGFILVLSVHDLLWPVLRKWIILQEPEKNKVFFRGFQKPTISCSTQKWHKIQLMDQQPYSAQHRELLCSSSYHTSSKNFAHLLI